MGSTKFLGPWPGRHRHKTSAAADKKRHLGTHGTHGCAAQEAALDHGSPQKAENGTLDAASRESGDSPRKLSVAAQVCGLPGLAERDRGARGKP